MEPNVETKEWTLQRHWGGEPFWDDYLHPGCMRLQTSRTNPFEQKRQEDEKRKAH